MEVFPLVQSCQVVMAGSQRSKEGREAERSSVVQGEVAGGSTVGLREVRRDYPIGRI